MPSSTKPLLVGILIGIALQHHLKTLDAFARATESLVLRPLRALADDSSASSPAAALAAALAEARPIPHVNCLSIQ